LNRFKGYFSKKFFSLLLIFIFGFSCIIAIQPVRSAGEGNAIVAMPNEVSSLNCYYSQTPAEFYIENMIYDSMVELDQNGNDIPWLAESWYINDTAPPYRNWIVHLVRNATWHDGLPVTAYDVEFSFNYIKNAGPLLAGVWFPSVMDLNFCKALDDYTLWFQMKADKPLWDVYVGRMIKIVPQHIWKDVTDPVTYTNLNAIGSGPWKLKSLKPGEVVLENTGQHFRVHPKINTITFKVFTNIDAALMALQKGEIDAILQEVAPLIVNNIRNKPAEYPNLKACNESGLFVTTFAFNHRIYPYDILEFRRAVSMCIDYDRIINDVYFGYASHINPGLVPHIYGWHNPNIPPYEHNVTKARELLEQAGFKDINGDGWREKPDGSEFITPIMTEPDQPACDTADIIIQNMAEIGLKAYRDTKPSGTVLSTLFDAGTARWSWSTCICSSGSSFHMQQYPEDMMWYNFYSTRTNHPGYNIAGFKNSTFDYWADLMVHNFNKTEMWEQHWKLQEIVADQVPVIGLFVRNVLNVYREDYVTGWIPLGAQMYNGYARAGQEYGINNRLSFENIHEASPGSSYNRGGTGLSATTTIIIATIVVVCIAAIAASLYLLRKRRRKLVE
jgi:peptide/nickel transport system substrate-binding protein